LTHVGGSFGVSHGGGIGASLQLGGSIAFSSQKYPLPWVIEFESLRAFPIGPVVFVVTPEAKFKWGFQVGGNIQLNIGTHVGYSGAASVGLAWDKGNGISGNGDLSSALTVVPPINFDMSCSVGLNVTLYNYLWFHFSATIGGFKALGVRAFSLGVELPFTVGIGGSISGGTSIGGPPNPPNGCNGCAPINMSITGGLKGPSEVAVQCPIVCPEEDSCTKEPKVTFAVSGEYSTCLHVPPYTTYLAILCGASSC